ncbi:phenylalanyl-tRNA synthetase [Saitoella complicata NRRL Y-17804]|uniref:Phenylalanine--tRNA ligase beta subunit n=1 Tax=Saitoella complicata (strain BCRC 22490 / CBS 7301 / JCM 7358 / NBRC 10748 / NRRL Y-17804) TaxID=698492 RepID=A0A0E9NEX7_SAICN|nr:phenylalanyl-tRNA synthetase [Saitoella complicata NRRL Y-17804]ODQ50790.1 phenylalanyl-tRNA synthetase [Saitoella complicata NRRL Y-17804]GAO48276.1 hypothetical protein G7K_2454-t1 [Saitoella complicata NRRL Y-17804]
MPTVNVDKADLFELLGREYTTEEFDELCFDFGIELDEDTSLDPVIVNGVPERPLLKIDIPANRYDLLCIEGIATSLNVFRGKQEPPNFRLVEAKEPITLTVKPETEQIRPYVAVAVLRGVKFNPRRYSSFIALQDKLHNNLCRNRSLVAIGTHDLDTVKGPFTYEALKPEEIKFVPLSQTKEWNAKDLMEHYEQEKSHLGRYVPIIKDSPVYPVIYDAERRVCSLPPIINSEHSKISLDTTNVLIECTATDKTKLEVVINTMVAMFSVYCAEPFTIEPVNIVSEHNGCTRQSPNVTPRKTTAEASYINSVCGLKLSNEEICTLLKRMSLAATPSSQNDILDVSIPITRADILHQCDIMEDAAIAYGYNNLPHTFPANSATVGQPFPINKLSDIIRREAAQAGWTEVMPLILCSHDENFSWLNRKDDGTQAVKLANPKTAEYQVVRTSLLPGVLKTVRENRKEALPIKVFEASDVVFKDEREERRARNERRFCAVWASKTAGFEVVHGLLDRIMRMLSVNPTDKSSKQTGYWIEETDDGTFFPGRAANVWYLGEEMEEAVVVGVFGVLHPEVLEKFEIPFACSGLELNLEVFL